MEMGVGGKSDDDGHMLLVVYRRLGRTCIFGVFWIGGEIVADEFSFFLPSPSTPSYRASAPRSVSSCLRLR